MVPTPKKVDGDQRHTFHLPCGEHTITLEDVYMLLGPRVEGKFVNGQVNQDNAICTQLLGADLIVDTARGQGIHLRYLKAHYSSMVLTAEATEKEKIMKTQCYIMILFGNFLFPEKTSNSINMMYLSLLRNLNKTRTYSWGSTSVHKRIPALFFSCVFLLQAWGWSRMPMLAPLNERGFRFPYATK